MINIKSFALFLGLAFASQVSGALAQNPTETTEKPINIALIDQNVILRESLAIRDIGEQIVAFRGELRKTIQKEEDALKTADQELGKKRVLLTAEAFAEERRNFENKLSAVQQLIQKRKRSIDEAQAVAMINVNKALDEIITGIAKQRGINLILHKTATILVTPSLEITADVLKQLNDKLPKVKVEKPVTQ